MPVRCIVPSIRCVLYRNIILFYNPVMWIIGPYIVCHQQKWLTTCWLEGWRSLFCIHMKKVLDSVEFRIFIFLMDIHILVYHKYFWKIAVCLYAMQFCGNFKSRRNAPNFLLDLDANLCWLYVGICRPKVSSAMTCFFSWFLLW